MQESLRRCREAPARVDDRTLDSHIEAADANHPDLAVLDLVPEAVAIEHAEARPFAHRVFHRLDRLGADRDVRPNTGFLHLLEKNFLLKSRVTSGTSGNFQNLNYDYDEKIPRARALAEYILVRSLAIV